MAAEDEGYAMAIGRAIKTVDPKIIYVALYGSEMEKAAVKLGLPLARESFPDRLYDDDGNLASRTNPGVVLKDPKAAAEQAVRMAGDGEIIARNGKKIKIDVHTLCVHGDEATGVAVARAIHEALAAAGIKNVPLTEMKL
jgi:UPF0271 protein